MKIAFIAGRDVLKKDDTDGATVLIYHLAEYLASRGHTIDIYTPKQYKGGNYRTEPQAQDAANLPPFLPNINFIEFCPPEIANLTSTDRPEQYFLNRILISEKEAEFFAEHDLRHYGCVYVFHVAHLFGLVAKNLLPLEKTVLFPMMLGSFYSKFMPVPKEYLEHEQDVLKKIHHISSPSFAEMEILEHEYSVDKHHLFKTLRGFNQNVFIPTLRKEIDNKKPIRILCANGVRPQKGQHFFVALAQYAREHNCPLEIHLVGVNGRTHNDWYNTYAQTLAHDIKEQNLEEFFCIHQALTQEELFKVMQVCDIAFYPSITETFGKSSLESVVSGLPTIVFEDVPAFKEYIVDRVTGMRISRTVEAAYQAINELKNNKELYASISSHGIASAHDFTWSHIFDQMMNEQAKRGLTNL